MSNLNELPFFHLDNEGFRLAIFDQSIGRINFDYDRLSSLKFNPLLSEREYNFSLCIDSDPDANVWFQKISIPPPRKTIGNSEGEEGLKGRNFQGVGGFWWETAFPKGQEPRTKNESNIRSI